MIRPIFRKFWIIISLAVFVTGCDSQPFGRANDSHFSLTSYETNHFHNPSSEFRITLEELGKWDQTVLGLLRSSPLGIAQSSRLYAYLYCAQKDFADASFQLSSAYSGSLDLISYQIIKLFFPKFEPPHLKVDPFTKELTALLMKQVKRRISREQKNIRPVAFHSGRDSWKGKDPVERVAPSMKPWAMKKNNEFQVPSPPSVNSREWDKQLSIVKQRARDSSNTQRQRSFFWSKVHTPEASDWKFIAQNYMNTHEIPIQMQMQVRARLAKAIIDGVIAVFHDKYKYMVKRPDMRDPNLRTLFPNPNHPSYPSGHSTVSTAAETILLYYFPENSRKWRYLAEEAGQSRLWAGIHFPIDLEVGQKQGEKVGKAVLFR